MICLDNSEIFIKESTPAPIINQVDLYKNIKKINELRQIKIGRLMRLISRTIAVCFFAVLIGIPAWSEDLAIVVSRTAPAYLKALQSFSGQTQFSYRVFNMEGDAQKGSEIMGAFSPNDFKIVVTIGGEAALLIPKINPALPVVFSMVFAPVEEKRDNLSGVYIKIEAKEQLSVIKKIFPTKKRIGMIYNPPANGNEVIAARVAADTLEMPLLPIALEKAENLPLALSKLTAENVDIIWMIVDPIVGQPESVEKVIAHARNQKIFLFGFSLGQVKAGAFAAFAVDYDSIGRQTVDLVNRINNGLAKNVQESPKRIVVYVNDAMQRKVTDSTIANIPGIELVK